MFARLTVWRTSWCGVPGFKKADIRDSLAAAKCAARVPKRGLPLRGPTPERADGRVDQFWWMMSGREPARPTHPARRCRRRAGRRQTLRSWGSGLARLHVHRVAAAAGPVGRGRWGVAAVRTGQPGGGASMPPPVARRWKPIRGCIAQPRNQGKPHVALAMYHHSPPRRCELITLAIIRLPSCPQKTRNAAAESAHRQRVNRQQVEDQQAKVDREDRLNEALQAGEIAVNAQDIELVCDDKGNGHENDVDERSGDDAPQDRAGALWRIDERHPTERPKQNPVRPSPHRPARQGMPEFVHQHDQKQRQVFRGVPGHRMVFVGSALDFDHGHDERAPEAYDFRVSSLLDAARIILQTGTLS